MPTLALPAMLAITSLINKLALFVLSNIALAAIKVDNVSCVPIIVMGLIVINFAHLFAKYATVKYATNALLVTTLAQQALAKH